MFHAGCIYTINSNSRKDGSLAETRSVAIAEDEFLVGPILGGHVIRIAVDFGPFLGPPVHGTPYSG